MAPFTLKINGQLYEIDADPDMPLLWVLRDMLNLTGTKYSCGMGLCGACTVHRDGEPLRACITSVSDVGDNAITTIEGLSPEANHPVQQAWIALNVPQCGYCQPGQIMTAAALLARNPAPTEDEIHAAMSGVLCRCGTYPRIRNAIRYAIEQGGDA